MLKINYFFCELFLRIYDQYISGNITSPLMFNGVRLSDATFRIPLWLSNRLEVLRSLCMIQLSCICATPRNS